MQHTLRTLLFVLFLTFFAGRLSAFNPPPANDSVWGATNLGFLPAPSPCPSGTGDSIVVAGSTSWAVYNSFDFSPVHCFPAGSPDVWYRFTASGTSVMIDAAGYNGLDTFFVKLFHSQGSCFSIVPLTCEPSMNGTISAVFQTPDIGGEYYLQIGGNDWYKTGDFTLEIKAFNTCNECVKNADVVLTPAPWFGRYGIGETVEMCMTVDMWDYSGDADLHGIVPRFGADWDLSTLVPVSAPQSASVANSWHWFTNVPTPDGPADGFFYDLDGDGNPSNNNGDAGALLTSWTGCWKISSLPYCNVYDLDVDISTYSDAQTGSATPAFACAPSAPIHLGIAGWCCPSPQVTSFSSTSCTGNGGLLVTGTGNAGDVFDYVVYDTGYTVVGSAQNMTGAYTFSNLPPGEYNIEAYNQTDFCIGYATAVIAPAFEAELVQTALGCGSGTASAEANPAGGAAPFTFDFPQLSSAQQQDSLAFQVPDGWLTVTVTDNNGCTATDSVWIISQGMPDATFAYQNAPACSTVGSIPVTVAPSSPGGTFQLVAPLSSGITVNAQSGAINISSSTAAAPYWIFVKYTVGTSNCQDAMTDSVLVVALPNAPTPVGPTTINYCIGAPSPSLAVIVPSTELAGWYDVQTGISTIGSMLTLPLNGSTTPGIYYYAVGSSVLATGSCTSPLVMFTVNASYPPVITASADTIICKGETTILAGSGCSNCSVAWNPQPTLGSMTAMTVPTAPMLTVIYTITATDSAGCTSTDAILISVNDCENEQLHVYSGFTPNGDGRNDLWIIDGIEMLQQPHVTIFNRWGVRVWDKAGYDNNSVVWNGHDMNGTPLPDGTYYYIITSEQPGSLKGWVELSH
jgi:gliding motility-associated-like protein